MAPLILSFLHVQFKASGRTTIPKSELEEKLGNYLEFLRETKLDAYLRSPKEYLNGLEPEK